MAKLTKSAWLYKYKYELDRRTKSCKKSLRWEQFGPAGHMYFEEGKLTPKKAAARYLATTRFGKQACVRR